MSAKTKTTKTTKASTKSSETETPVKAETVLSGDIKVKAIKPFFDLESHRNRLLDDEFICSAQRAKHLAKNGFVEVL